jgi:hypothetical protein
MLIHLIGIAGFGRADCPVQDAYRPDLGRRGAVDAAGKVVILPGGMRMGVEWSLGCA